LENAWKANRVRRVPTKRKDVPIEDASPGLFEAAGDTAGRERTERLLSVPGLRLGTSAFTAAGWVGAFYPAGMRPADYLTYYATKFDTVEVDSTFYRTPSASTVRGWYAKTPKDFIFALKVPQEITHERVLHDCDAEFKAFLSAADLLGEKLGPVLFQFGYFNKEAFAGLDEFLALLLPFMKKLPGGYKFAVEIRNKNWLVPKFVDVLRSHGVALTVIDQSWMPRPAEWFARFDPITTDFTYIRWLGDRKLIEEKTKTWDKTIVDRTSELQVWVKYCHLVQKRGITIYAYANNHFAGHAPATIAQFLKLWNG
jgi:uncharacterized protein YecE (DUF72 family)